MNKKLIMTAAALLALTTLAGCNIKSGGGSSSNNPDSSSEEPDTNVTVTFDLNYAGAPAAQTVTVEKGDYVDEPDAPSRDGYYFNGWYESQDASGEEFDFFLTPIEEDLTLYADWTAAYTVTFYKNAPEAQEQEVYDTQTVRANGVVSKPADPKISGFAFKGWFKTAACLEADEFNFATSITADLSLYAKWAEPDWSVISDAVAKYLSFVSSVYGVSVPQFPNSDYSYSDDYQDCLVINGPDKCIAEYLPILEAAGYTVDAENNEASNEYVTLKLSESDEPDAKGNRFQMLLIINGTGESETFCDLGYQVGTQQNFITLPNNVTKLFSRFEVYKGNLTTGDPCASVSLYFDAKPEGSTLTDEQYYNQKVSALASALGSNYSTGYFTDTGGLYFYDKAYLTMNQVYSYDAATPLMVKLLSYSYLALYGNGVTINKVDKNVFAAASAEALWKTTASFGLDLAPLAASYAANSKNFIVGYDVGTRTSYVEVDIMGVKATNAALNGVMNAVLTAVNSEDNWEIFQDGQDIYAYHYSNDNNGNKKADAKLTLDYTYNSTTRAIYNGAQVEIVLNPVDVSWDADAVAGYFAQQALPGDNPALPEFTGSFAFAEFKTSEYGDYFDIYMKYTDPTEVQAYLSSLLAEPYNYSLVGQDSETGAVYFASTSGNFELIAYVGQDSFELIINAAPTKSCAYDASALATLNALLNARNGYELPAGVLGVLTGTYTGINYYSYFDIEDDAGYTNIELVSNVTEAAAEGSTTAVEDDVAAIKAYFATLNYEYDSTNDVFEFGEIRIVVRAIAPTASEPSVLRLVVVANPPVEMDNGHVIKYSSTKYVADNGDAFLLGVAHDAILNIDQPYYNGYVKGKVEDSKLPSLYNALPDNSAYVNTTLILSDFSTYDSAITYNFWLTTVLNDTTEDKAVLTAAVNAYITALGTAGFVAKKCQIFNPALEGYWCADSGEFVVLSSDADTNSIVVDVYFIGKEMRNYVR